MKFVVQDFHHEEPKIEQINRAVSKKNGKRTGEVKTTCRVRQITLEVYVVCEVQTQFELLLCSQHLLKHFLALDPLERFPPAHTTYRYHHMKFCDKFSDITTTEQTSSWFFLGIMYNIS